jgi:hypothetical protein
LTGDVDILDVVSVLTRGNYGQNSEAHAVLEERDPRFDDISFEEAKRMSRRAYQALRPHIIDGVVPRQIWTVGMQLLKHRMCL